MSDLNDPRVLMAAERTALAWLRTALTLLAFGVAMERFALFLHMLKPDLDPARLRESVWVGALMMALSGLTAIGGTLQYRSVLKSLKPAEIPAGYHLLWPQLLLVLVALVAAALTTAALLGV